MFVANQCINRLWSWWDTYTKTQAYRNTLLLELYGNCVTLLFIFEVSLLLPTSLHNSTRVFRKSKCRSTQWLGYCHRMKVYFAPQNLYLSTRSCLIAFCNDGWTNTVIVTCCPCKVDTDRKCLEERNTSSKRQGRDTGALLIPNAYLSSYPGYFRELHWKSMGLPEMPWATWQVCYIQLRKMPCCICCE